MISTLAGVVGEAVVAATLAEAVEVVVTQEVGAVAVILVAAAVAGDLLAEVVDVPAVAGLSVADVRVVQAAVGVHRTSVVVSLGEEFARLDHNSVVRDEHRSIAHLRSVSPMQVGSTSFARRLVHQQDPDGFHKQAEDTSMEFNRVETSAPTDLQAGSDNRVPTLCMGQTEISDGRMEPGHN